MHLLSNLVKGTIPNYLSNLPIPDSFGGWFRLGIKDWFALIPPTAAIAGISYATYLAIYQHARPDCGGQVNPSILKHNKKVVETVDVEDISEKAVFCRCWRTKNWPYCDGAHGSYNRESGDNVGPLVIKRSK